MAFEAYRKYSNNVIEDLQTVPSLKRNSIIRTVFEQKVKENRGKAKGQANVAPFLGAQISTPAAAQPTGVDRKTVLLTLVAVVLAGIIGYSAMRGKKGKKRK